MTCGQVGLFYMPVNTVLLTCKTYELQLKIHIRTVVKTPFKIFFIWCYRKQRLQFCNVTWYWDIKSLQYNIIHRHNFGRLLTSAYKKKLTQQRKCTSASEQNMHNNRNTPPIQSKKMHVRHRQLSRLKTASGFALGKCHQFSWAKKWRTFRKTGCYWAEEYATSQLHKRK